MKLATNFNNMVKLQMGWPRTRVVIQLVYLAVAALAIGFEQLVQWKYGPMGIVAFLALSIGIKAKNTVIGGIGAVILVMLLAH